MMHGQKDSLGSPESCPQRGTDWKQPKCTTRRDQVNTWILRLTAKEKGKNEKVLYVLYGRIPGYVVK